MSNQNTGYFCNWLCVEKINSEETRIESVEHFEKLDCVYNGGIWNKRIRQIGINKYVERCIQSYQIIKIHRQQQTIY